MVSGIIEKITRDNHGDVPNTANIQESTVTSSYKDIDITSIKKMLDTVVLSNNNDTSMEHEAKYK